MHTPLNFTKMLASISKYYVCQMKCLFTYFDCGVWQVWQIRVDVHVLNHDGNLMDAASISAISALSHFRRPDASTLGQDITVVRLVTPE